VQKTIGGIPEQFPAGAGTRLLLVDDNPKLCRMVKEYLEPLGYEVSLACTGTDGLEKALQGGFHAVILDLWYPDSMGLRCSDGSVRNPPAGSDTDRARRTAGRHSWSELGADDCNSMKTW
jgi:DNA-binding response OmpR family regulator